MVRGQLIFISGGVRSGKSAYAEDILTNRSQGRKRLVYIASGQATDDEMQERIQLHKESRASFNWQTIECPVNLAAALPFIEQDDYILWDCMTTWLANELYEGWETGAPCIEQPNCMAEKAESVLQAIDKLVRLANIVVIVSNEVFHELPSAYRETETYRKWLGYLHQQVVRKADCAIEMESSLPIVWKGDVER